MSLARAEAAQLRHIARHDLPWRSDQHLLPTSSQSPTGFRY
jgi:hypothetical protein